MKITMKAAKPWINKQKLNWDLYPLYKKPPTENDLDTATQ